MIEALETRIAPAALVFANQAASGYDTKTPITTDSEGNIIIAGVFDETITLGTPGLDEVTLATQDTGTGAPVGTDIYIAKYRPDGSLIWAHSWGGLPKAGANAPQESAVDIAVDGNDDILLLVNFSTMNAGEAGIGTLTAAGADFFDVALLKYGKIDGTLAPTFGMNGVVTFGGAGNDVAESLALRRSSGEIFVTGGYDSATPVFNGVAAAPGTSGGIDGFAFKTSTANGGLDTGFGAAGFVRFGAGGAEESGFDLAVSSTTGLFLAVKDAGTSILKFDSNTGALINGFGNSGRLDVPNLAAIAPDNNGNVLATGGIASPGGYLKKFRGADGSADGGFDTDGTVDLGTQAQSGFSIVVDTQGAIIVAGSKSIKANTQSSYFLAKYNPDGSPNTSFGTSGRVYFANSGKDNHRSINLAIDTNGYLSMRGFFSGTTDIDPTKTVRTATALTPSPTTLHPDLDTFLARIDPNGVDATNPFVFTDASGDIVTVKFKGTGRLSVVPGTTPGVDIERIETYDTDITSILKVAVKTGGIGTTIARIVTPGGNQHLGTVKLGSGVTLGSGLPGLPALEITGSSTKISITNVAANATIKLGGGLPYDDPDPAIPDTYSQRPKLTLTNVGNGVTIDVTGDGLPGGVGGGGLGKVSVTSWLGTGLIKTTQSVSSFTLKTGDCFVDLRLDADGVGALTTANIGSISIPNGAWGASNTDIEGVCDKFSCESFLATATLNAGAINKFKVKAGIYAGTTTLTDAAALGLGTASVNGNFTGVVNSQASIINVKVKGDFNGTLLAKSIGTISAFTFDGDVPALDDGIGDPARRNIVATSGSIGYLKSSAGGIANYEVVALTTFGGPSAANKIAANGVIGIDNLSVSAGGITAITVNLKAATGVIGIQNSTFQSVATGIGKVSSSHSVDNTQIVSSTNITSVTIGGAADLTAGITDSYILAGTDFGDDGLFGGIGLDADTFTKAASIGSITVLGSALTTTFATGVNPGATFVYGDGDDTLGSGVSPLFPMGAIKLGSGSGTFQTGPAQLHNFAIIADNLKSVKVGLTTVTTFASDRYIRVGGSESPNDIIIRAL